MIARSGPAFVTRQCSFKKWQSHITPVRFELTGKIEIAKNLAPNRQAMSLIPSESYSFPDHFTTTVIPSRKPKNAEPSQVQLETRPKRPSIVALPNPQPRPAPAAVTVLENSEPVRSKSSLAAPNPALRRANAAPPRIPVGPRKIALPASLKPKVRWNLRAPAMDPAPIAENGAEQLTHEPPAAPAQNVIPMKPARVPQSRRMMPPPGSLVPQNPLPTTAPKPAQIAKVQRPAQSPMVIENPGAGAPSNPQADLFEMFAQSGETALSKRRRKVKMRRFIACEIGAVAILLPLAILGLSHRPDNPGLLWILNISTIASAVAAALIPILFFAFTPTLPEIER